MPDPSPTAHTPSAVARAEAAKWDAYYNTNAAPVETPAMAAFHAELVAALRPLLPAGASVLEAGCGAGFQSLALARDGGFRVSLLDISGQALGAARRVFDAAGVPVEAAQGDAFAAGEPAHDLVFNAGVLEHYTLDQQAAFLRGMASRSRKYVLALVPNRLCYWYWLWRVQQTAGGNWPFGKECPPADLGESFRAAGLTYLGRAFLGATWTEDLIGHVRGMAPALRDHVLGVHRSALLDPAQRGYLVAALGCVGDPPASLPPQWSVPDDDRGEIRTAELTSALADALALKLRADAELREAAAVAERLAVAEAERDAARDQEAMAAGSLRTFRQSAAYRLAEKILRARQAFAPKGGLRSRAAGKLVRAAKATLRPLTRAYAGRGPAPDGFDAVLTRVRSTDRRPVVFLPSIPWNTALFQRPQHLARELAKLGHVVVYDCTGSGQTVPRVTEIEPNVFLYDGPPRHLTTLPDPVVWAFTYNYADADAYPPTATRVYDWIDDLAVFPHDPRMLKRNHARALREADAVFSVARRLHDEAAAVRPDAVYLPNAAEFERFADPAVRPAEDPALADLLARSSAVAGYYGALASWFDYALVKEVAYRLPDWAFVLIGPDYDGSLRTAGLDEVANVRWVGTRDYTTLPRYLKRFDVATIPFVINDITLATSPLKLFEYFSGGTPVVTTPMPECVAFPEVRIAATADEFAAALEAARADARRSEVRARLKELGRANSWAARANQVAEVLGGNAGPQLAVRRAA